MHVRDGQDSSSFSYRADWKTRCPKEQQYDQTSSVGGKSEGPASPTRCLGQSDTWKDPQAYQGGGEYPTPKTDENRYPSFVGKRGSQEGPRYGSHPSNEVEILLHNCVFESTQAGLGTLG